MNVATQRDETNIPETKNHASYHNYLNVNEYIIKASIFVLFGISVVLLLTIFYVYIRQKMHEARSFLHLSFNSICIHKLRALFLHTYLSPLHNKLMFHNKIKHLQ